jgi:acylpyruvate hydrolase
VRLANVLVDGTERAAIVEDDQVTLLDEDLASALESVASGQDVQRSSTTVPLDSVQLLAPVADGAKFLCVGLNYYSHMAEAGLPKPDVPIIFTKFPSVLIGPEDEIIMPNTSTMIDWEVEVGVVIGRRVREVDETQAAAAIAGYTVVNDVSARDFQLHTSQWTPGKNLESSTPVGPWIVSVDELGPNPDLGISTRVDGVVRQDGRTTDAIFTPAQIIAYVSGFITLEPGDIIATGTCEGVGHLMETPTYLQADQVLETTIEHIGTLTNRCVGGRVPVSSF